jgi:lactose/L-arabinose transport system substrate-binding protein
LIVDVGSSTDKPNVVSFPNCPVQVQYVEEVLKMKTKLTAIILAIALLVVLLPGCNAATPAASAPAAQPTSVATTAPSAEPAQSAAPEKTPVMTKKAAGQEVVAWGWDKPEFNKVMEDYILEVSGVTTKGQTMAQADEIAKITAASVAGTGLPDCFKLNNTDIPRLVDQGAIKDLTELVAPFKDLLPQAAWDEVTYQGKIWGIPANSPAAGMFYRYDVLQKYGIDPDTLTTWDKWIEAGKKVAMESAGKVMWINYPKNGMQGALGGAILQQCRAEILSADAKVTVDSDNFKNALTLQKKIIDANFSAEFDDWTAPWYQAMKDGTVACYPSGTWYIETIIQQAPDTKGDWYFVPFPAVTEGGDRYANFGSATCFISSQTTKVDAAFEWCKAWTLDEKGTLDIGLKQLGISVVSNAALNNAFVNSPNEYCAKSQAYWKVATETFTKSTYVPPFLAQSSEASGIWNRYYAEWRSGAKSMEDVLSQAAAEIKTKLKLQ